MKDLERVINERLDEVNKLLNLSDKQIAKYKNRSDIRIQTSVTNGTVLLL